MFLLLILCLKKCNVYTELRSSYSISVFKSVTLKRFVHPKIKIWSSFAHPYAVPNPQGFTSSWKRK